MSGKKADVRAGDHIVFTGIVDDVSGAQKAVLYHEDGTCDTVFANKEESNDGCHQIEPCAAYPGISQIGHVVQVGTGHGGPAFVNCAAFRDRIEAMFGKHPLDPDNRQSN